MTHSFIPTPELVIHTGAQTDEANAEFRAQPVIVEVKIRKCSA